MWHGVVLTSLRPLPFPGHSRTKKDVIVFTLRHRFPINTSWTSWKCCRESEKNAFSCVIMMNYCFLSGEQCQWLKIVEVKTCATYKGPWISPLLSSASPSINQLIRQTTRCWSNIFPPESLLEAVKTFSAVNIYRTIFLSSFPGHIGRRHPAPHHSNWANKSNAAKGKRGDADVSCSRRAHARHQVVQGWHGDPFEESLRDRPEWNAEDWWWA